MHKRGRYIVIEGVDGSGKTTQFNKLLEALGPSVLGVREPGGTPVGEKLRDIIKDKSLARDPHTNMWLLMAARAELVNSVIRPAILAGKTVVSDRSWLSTVAYQSAEGVDVKFIKTLAKQAVAEFFWPDLIIFIDVPDKIQRQRTLNRGGHEKDYFDGLSSDYFSNVRRGYIKNLQAFKNVKTIDGTGSPAEVFARILKII